MTSDGVDSQRVEARLLVRVSTVLSADPDNGPETVRYLVEEDLRDLGYEANATVIDGYRAVRKMEAGDEASCGVGAAYLQGVLISGSFVSEGKCFWVTDDEDRVDDRHVCVGDLYLPVREVRHE